MSSVRIEQKALLHDRSAVIRVVSALRSYRAAAQALLAYKNVPHKGAVVQALRDFEAEVNEIEEYVGDEEG